MAKAADGSGSLVLVVDDDVAVSSLLAQHLTAEGFVVDTANSARGMWQRVDAAWPSAFLLDIGLPDGNGLELVSRIRDRGDAAILMLTVRASVEDRSIGLDGGADDYIAKPFHLREVTSRLRAVLRRLDCTGRKPPQKATTSGWVLDRKTGQLVGPDKRSLQLTAAETRLWAALAAAPGEPVDRDTLSMKVRGVAWEPNVRALDVLVSRLRQRVEHDPKHPTVILTVRNRGYMLATHA